MKKILVAFVTFMTLSAIAQDGPKVVVFNSSGEDKKEPSYWLKHNLVKFNIFEAFAGDFSFYYERILNDNMSAEIGFGPTLSNYISLIWNDNSNIFDDNYEALMGFSFMLGGRYYPMHAADEFYVAPEFKYKYYHNNEYYQDLAGMDQVMEESWRMAMGRLTFGYMYFFDDNIFIDFSAGFGIGKVSQTNLDWQTNDQGFLEPIADTRSILAPRFHTGLKVGVAF